MKIRKDSPSNSGLTKLYKKIYEKKFSKNFNKNFWNSKMKLQTILFLNAAEAVFKAPKGGKDRSGYEIDRKHPFKRLTV